MQRCDTAPIFDIFCQEDCAFSLDSQKPLTMITNSMSPRPISLPASTSPASRGSGACTRSMTIIEVMMAIVILVLAVMTVFSAMATGRSIADTNQIRARVLAVIQAQLEYLQGDNTGAVVSNINAFKYDAAVVGLAPPAGRASVVQIRLAGGAQPLGTNPARLYVVTADAQWVSRQQTDIDTTEYISPITYYYADPTAP